MPEKISRDCGPRVPLPSMRGRVGRSEKFAGRVQLHRLESRKMPKASWLRLNDADAAILDTTPRQALRRRDVRPRGRHRALPGICAALPYDAGDTTDAIRRP